MIKDFWSPLHAVIEQSCANFDKIWQTRKRIITTQILVVFILKLVLSKNKQGYKILLNELWESKEFSILQQHPIAASSVCEARQKMPENIFSLLNRQIIKIREESKTLPLWRGHRVFGVDGSKINVPRELLKDGYKAPNKNQYYPQGLMSTLYNLGSGLIYDGLLTSGKNERTCLLAHMEQLLPNDIVVLDRGYFSYLVLNQAIEKGVHLVCRMQSGNVNKAVQSFWDSDEMDKTIIYDPSVTVKYECKKQGYDIIISPIKLRLIKYVIDNETYVCGTTLLCEETYPLSEFPSVYHGRWGIEELYKISKELIDVEDFHSKSERGVMQECYAHMLLINLARIFEAETDEQLPPPINSEPILEPLGDDNDLSQAENKDDDKNSYWQNFCGEIKQCKINFKHCLLVLGRSLEKILFPNINNTLFECIPNILNSLSRVRQKIRPGRHTPRQSRKRIDKWRSSNGEKVNYT